MIQQNVSAVGEEDKSLPVPEAHSAVCCSHSWRAIKMNDEKSFIVILTRGTSAAAWQSEDLIKRLESPSLCDSFHSSDEWKV